MLEFFAGTLALCMVIALWAAIGHGIWMLVAAIGRALFGHHDDVPKTACDNCKSPNGVIRGRCRYCGAIETIVPPMRPLVEELRGSLRQIERLWRRGIISDEEHARLMAACQRDLDRVLERPKPTVREQARPVPSVELASELITAEIIDAEVVTMPTSVEQPAQLPKAGIHPLDRPEPVVAPVAPPPPRVKRALADVLSAFMQERNIRWGELVSGLLIVGSAAGLVLSLRDQLREWIPFFPAFLFLLATSAIHGAGLYTLRKWNLQATSRGVLTISMLLVPLNFLAAILISGDSVEQVSVFSATYIVAVTIGLLSFGTICITGARALAGTGWMPIAGAVFGASAAQLVINRAMSTTASATQVLWLGSLASTPFIAAVFVAIIQAQQYRRLSWRRAQPLVMTLALGGFALLLPLAVIVGRGEPTWSVLSELSPLMALLGATIIAAGRMLSVGARNKTMLPLAITGTALAVSGALLMLAAVCFAWPEPVRLMVVGATSASALAALAWWVRMPMLQVPSVACAALVALVALHYWQGELDGDAVELSRRIRETWLMGRSGLLLAGLSGVVAALAAFLQVRKSQEYASYLLLSAAGLMLLSLGNAVVAGFFVGTDAALTTLVFAAHAAALMVVTSVKPQRAITAGAAVLGLVTIVHAVGYNEPIREWLAVRSLLAARPVLLATLFAYSLMALLSVVVTCFGRNDRRYCEVARPLAAVACYATLLSLWSAVAVVEQRFALHAGYVAVIAVVWLAAAVVLTSPAWMTAGQSLVLWSVSYAALAVSHQQSWWDDRWWDPRTMALVIGSLAACCAVFAIMRRMASRWAMGRQVCAPPWPGADQVMLVILMVIACGGILAAVGLGIGDELHWSRRALSPTALGYLATLHDPVVLAAVALLAIALLAALWDRLSVTWVLLLQLWGLIPCGLFALQYVEVAATASAFRWTLAMYLLEMVAAICTRQWWLRAGPALRFRWNGTLPGSTLPVGIGLALVMTALPIIMLTLLATGLAAQWIAPRGPLAGSFFAEIGLAVSYVAPLAAVTIALLAIALRQREAGFVMPAALVWQLMVSLGVVMPVLTTGGMWDASLTLRLWQYNAIGMGTFALLWNGIAPWLTKEGRGNQLLRMHVLALFTALAGLAFWGTVSIVARAPLALPWPDLVFGSWHSYVALAIAAGLLAWQGHSQRTTEHAVLCAVCMASAVSFVAASLGVWDSVWSWTSYHTLLTGWLVAAAVALVAARFMGRERSAHLVATTLASVVAALSFYSGWDDPEKVWGTLINLSAMAIFLALGIARKQQGYAYATIPLAIIYASQAYWQFGPSPTLEIHELLAINMSAVILVCGVWLAVEVERERSAVAKSSERWLPSVPTLVTPVVTTSAILLVAVGWFARAITNTMAGVFQFYASSPVCIAMMMLLGAYLLAMLWYDRQRSALACLFAWGLGVCVVVCDRFPLWHELSVVALPTIVAIYLALVGWIWNSSALLASYGQTMGIRQPIVGLERTSRWLPKVTMLIAILLCLADLGLVLVNEMLAVRYIAAVGPVLTALALVMQAQLERRANMLFAAFASVTFAAVLLGWAELSPGHSGVLWLQRSIRSLLVLGALAVIYAVVLPKVWSHLADWLTALRRVAVTCGALAGISFGTVLTLEITRFIAGNPGPISHAEVAMVAMVLCGLAGLLVYVALSTKNHWQLSEPQRMACIYGAQLLLALACGHLYITRPQWFDGLLKPYWPFIVMALAFGGVAIGEWCSRLRLRVLSEPLQKTGAFLPLLPALGWWVEAAIGEPTTDYALVMFCVGMLYVLLSMCRESLLSGIAAGVAGNVALWSLMAERGFDLIQRPQFWLIPPALSVLCGIQANRNRLSEEQLTASRYACLLVIYISSTSEIFLSGLTSVWPPLMLLALAVTGVFAGMALQVRAFLYVGTSFVFLSMVTMVWHASRAFDQVWPWWVFGICVGLAMLVFFGIFEKKRAEIALLVSKLRQWEH